MKSFLHSRRFSSEFEVWLKPLYVGFGKLLHETKLANGLYVSALSAILNDCLCLIEIDVWMARKFLYSTRIYVNLLDRMARLDLEPCQSIRWNRLNFVQLRYRYESAKLLAIAHYCLCISASDAGNFLQQSCIGSVEIDDCAFGKFGLRNVERLNCRVFLPGSIG